MNSVKLQVKTNSKNYPIIIDQEGGKVNRLNKLISLDNLTSEFFGKIYIKDKGYFNSFPINIFQTIDC